MTYDDWKTTDDTPEPEPDFCPMCHRVCSGDLKCGCCATCQDIAWADRQQEEPMPEGGARG